MKKTIITAILLFCAVNAQAKDGTHFRSQWRPVKNYTGPTDKKSSAVTSKYFDARLRSLEKTKEGGTTVYRGLSPEARRQENLILREQYMSGVTDPQNWR